MLAEQRPPLSLMPCSVIMLLKLGLVHTATTPALLPTARQRRHSPAREQGTADAEPDNMKCS